MLPVVVAEKVSEFRPQLGRQKSDRFRNERLVPRFGQSFGDVQGSQNDCDLVTCQHDLVGQPYQWAIVGHAETVGHPFRVNPNGDTHTDSTEPDQTTR